MLCIILNNILSINSYELYNINIITNIRNNYTTSQSTTTLYNVHCTMYNVHCTL